MDNDNKQMNKVSQVQENSTGFNISNSTVFSHNDKLIYIYKKTEKLISAIYMLSNFISDKEPMKWQMREAGIELLSDSLNMSDKTKFVSTVLKFLSFLEVSFNVGIISEMNYKILRFEFESLVEIADSSEKWADPRGLIFPENFFEVSSTKPTVNESKGQNIMSDRLSVKSLPPKISKTVSTTLKDKSNRQEIIISLLKKGKELGIKDFVSSISGCSEKTIQRELATLVSKGLIKKQGEKRWSRYSLK